MLGASDQLTGHLDDDRCGMLCFSERTADPGHRRLYVRFAGGIFKFRLTVKDFQHLSRFVILVAKAVDPVKKDDGMIPLRHQKSMQILVEADKLAALYALREELEVRNISFQNKELLDRPVCIEFLFPLCDLCHFLSPITKI